MSRIRVIALVGAGAISSAAICSLYLAYTLEDSSAEMADASEEATEERPQTDTPAAEEVTPTEPPHDGQAYLVGFLANADPQVRTLAAWGLVSDEEAADRQREILEFVRQEKDPQVRVALYRFLHGQRAIDSGILMELVREEEHHPTWLAGCDLLADAVKAEANPAVLEYFDLTVVPALKRSVVNCADLHCKIAAIIALRRAGTEEAVDALQDIIETSPDEQVVAAASSAVRLASAGE